MVLEHLFLVTDVFFVCVFCIVTLAMQQKLHVCPGGGVVGVEGGSVPLGAESLCLYQTMFSWIFQPILQKEPNL